MKFFLIGAFFLISCQQRVYKKIAPNFKFESYERALEKVNFVEEIPVDILFIIDNSASMDIYQNRLRKNFSSMINKIHSDPYLDYRIGVINTTAKNAGHFMTARNSAHSEQDRAFITKKDLLEDGAVFNNLVNRMIVGTDGSGNELVFYPLQKIIESERKFGDKSFFRKEAFLVIVIMTDEDDRSTDNTFPEAKSISPYEIVSTIKNLKQDMSKIIAFSITSGYIPEDHVREDINKTCHSQQKEEEGYVVRNLVSEFKGKNYSICGDFGKNLDSIGKIIKKRLHLFVPLNRVPIADSIKVYINGHLIPNDHKKGWFYDLDSVGIYISPDLKIDGMVVEDMGDLHLTIDFVPAKGDPEEAF